MSLAAEAQTYMERLNRGVVALPGEKGNFVSWRLLATDAPETSFNLLRDGSIIARSIKEATCFEDKKGTKESRYSVQAVVNGKVLETSEEVLAWDKPYLSVPLIRPLDMEMPDGQVCSYAPNDCSVGDMDGDGDYEIVVKWDPSNAHDNSHNGYTGNVYLDCYKTEGVMLWRIDLGKNIRAGAHYTQFMVYDFDGDGHAEVICKTAPGSKDGKGDYVTLAADDDEIRAADNEADYRNAYGHVLNGPEYLTIFNGKDGRAMHTIFYYPNRAFGVGGAPEYAKEVWGDKGPGNRGERYLACVAFLGGPTENPSVVMCRGYYTRSYLWAVDYKDGKLQTRWKHASLTPNTWSVTYADGTNISGESTTPNSAYGQGAHSIAVADVDGDGCDEITYGSAAIDHDGKMLYTTDLGHGDALHLADHSPDRPGLECYMTHESRPYGADLRDAMTGEIIHRVTGHEDTGRGMAADVDSNHRGSEMWCAVSKDVRNNKGEVIATPENWMPQNFRIFWDGDLQEELLADKRVGEWKPYGRSQKTSFIAKWNGNGYDRIPVSGKDFGDWGHSAPCNGSKSTPCLQADLFGDWREELVFYDASDRSHLNIFTTNIPTPYRVTTLMHDHVYRMGVAWQNVSYNQPPHLGYYLPDSIKKK